MMTARHGDATITAPFLEYDDVERVRRLGRERVLTCPDCQEAVHLRAGTKRMWHFAHYATTRACFLREDADYNPETPAHRWAKAALAQWLAGRLGSGGPLFGQARVDIEGRIPETGQFADVLCTTTEGRRIAFEVQVSPLSVSDWKRRAELYASAGVADVWLLCGPRWAGAGSDLGPLEAAILRERGRVFFLAVPEDLLETEGVARDGRTTWQHRLEQAMDGFVVTCLDGIARAFSNADGTPDQEEERQRGRPLAQRSTYLHAPAWAGAPDRYESHPFYKAGVFRGSLFDAVIVPQGRPGSCLLVSETHEAEAARAHAWDEASAAWTAAHGDAILRAQREAWLAPSTPQVTPLERQSSLWEEQRPRPTFDWEAARRREEAHEARSRAIVTQSVREMAQENRARREAETKLEHTLLEKTYTCTLCGQPTSRPTVIVDGGRIVKCRACMGGPPER